MENIDVNTCDECGRHIRVDGSEDDHRVLEDGSELCKPCADKLDNFHKAGLQSPWEAGRQRLVPQLKPGMTVKSREHFETSIGTILDVAPNGDARIEFVTPPSPELPYGVINLEVWPIRDQDELTILAALNMERVRSRSK